MIKEILVEIRRLVALVRRLLEVAESPPRMAYTVEETAKVLGLSYDKVLDLIASNDLAAVGTGKRYLISVEAIRRFLGETQTSSSLVAA